MRVLISGGAGFIGSSLGVELAERHGGWEIVALDNLHRRGSELNLARLREAGVRFVHGDVREADDIRMAGPFDALVECSAEPSALAGRDGDGAYAVRSNLLGAYNCFEEAARQQAQVIFLSTSRVYPVAALNSLAHVELDTRYALTGEQQLAGASERGVAEEFPLAGARTLYGATKLAAELLLTEYRAARGVRATVNRCGVVAGPWQMGRADQGVFAHWMLCFYFGRELAYLGFGGAGKQVRDVLHVADLAGLIDDQLTRPAHWDGAVVNVGGGSGSSLSLLETSSACRELTGRDLAIASEQRTRDGDVRIYLSDCGALAAYGDWSPRRSAHDVLGDIFAWVHDNERLLARALPEL